MRRPSVFITLAVAVLPLCRINAQQNPRVNSATTVPAEDRSPYLGKPVTHPESLSGLWEVSNGHGSTVGIHLLLTTTVPGDANTFRGTVQSWQSLEVGVYERKGAMLQMGDQNGFSDSPRGGDVSLEDGRLKLHFVPRVATDPAIDLDLVHDADGSWSGRFHRGAFDSHVTLRRPSQPDGAGASPIVGTWRDNRTSFFSCVHIVQQSPAGFVGWSDSLQLFGSMRIANGIPRPPTSIERYGELMKVDLIDSDRVSLELGAYNGICCSHTFVGTLTANRTLLEGAWPPGANQAPHVAAWKKMSGGSCLSGEE